MVQTIINPNKYLSQELVESFFKHGKITHVDKTVCGNGATTAFLEKHPPVGKTKILIAPNKGVVISKRNQYRHKSSYSFVYKESDDIIYGSLFVVIVVDTFFLKFDLIKQMAERGDIEAILVDEYHSMQQQSAFRPKLEMFINKLEHLKNLTKITTITATPTAFQDVDIRIENTHEDYQKPTIIQQYNDQKLLVSMAKKMVRSDKKVVIATNSSGIISQLADREKKLTANLIVGNTLLGSLTEKVIVTHDPECNLVVISSRGFEGVDVMGEGWTVFFFENRRNTSTTFYISNLIQAINRTRYGAKEIFYGRVNSMKQRPDIVSIEKIKDFIQDESISFEKKQSKEYEAINRFLIFDNDNDTITFNEWSYNLIEEAREYDNGLPAYPEYLQDRRIEIEDMTKETPNPIGAPRVRDAPFFLKQNEDIIKEHNLFGREYRLQAHYYEDLNIARRELDIYLRRKNFGGEYQPHERLLILHSIVNNEKLFKKIVTNATKMQRDYYYNVKFKNKPKEAKENFTNFSNNVVKNILNLMFCFGNEKISFKKEIVGSRDFNVLVRLGEDVLNYISEEVFNMKMVIFDIKNAYPRMLYALANDQLKDDFYGADKKNKVRINVLMNAAWSENPDKRKPAHVKAAVIKQFQRLNFNDNVIEYYMEHLYNRKHKDGVYNTMAKHEKKIIEMATKLLKDSAKLKETDLIKPYSGYGRRHDSVVFFDFIGDENTVHSVQYLGQFGWFK